MKKKPAVAVGSFKGNNSALMMIKDRSLGRCAMQVTV